MLGQIIHEKTQFKKIHSHYISTIQLQSSTELRFTYKLKLFLCVFVWMCWGCAFSTLDTLSQTSNKYVIYKCFSNQKKTEYLIHFIAAPTFQGYKHHDFLFKCCFGRIHCKVNCKSHTKLVYLIFLHVFLHIFFSFLWICVACFLDSDNFAPFPYFENCNALMKLQFSVRILEKKYNSCQE